MSNIDYYSFSIDLDCHCNHESFPGIFNFASVEEAKEGLKNFWNNNYSYHEFTHEAKRRIECFLFFGSGKIEKLKKLTPPEHHDDLVQCIDTCSKEIVFKFGIPRIKFTNESDIYLKASDTIIVNARFYIKSMKINFLNSIVSKKVINGIEYEAKLKKNFSSNEFTLDDLLKELNLDFNEKLLCDQRFHIYKKSVEISDPKDLKKNYFK